MSKDLRRKLRLVHVEHARDHFSTIWGLKFILFATKEEGMVPRGFGFLVHKSTHLFEKYGRDITGYDLVILFRPFPPLCIKWAFSCPK